MPDAWSPPLGLFQVPKPITPPYCLMGLNPSLNGIFCSFIWKYHERIQGPKLLDDKSSHSMRL